MSVSKPTPFSGPAIAAVLVALFAAALAAQSTKWADPYQKGLKAFNAKNYRVAITFFDQAVAAEPVSAPNKHVEGVFYTDYFPYYYLGVAHLELRQYVKAQENFNRARTGLTRPLLARLDEYEKRLTSELQIARGGGPLRGDPLPSNPPPPNSTPDPNVQARREEAARAAAGQQLASEAQQLLENSQLSAARSKFQQADQTLPGQSLVADGLAEIRRREDLYQRLTAGAAQDARGNSFQAALDKYAQAKAANPSQFSADGLEASVRSINDRLKAASSSRPEPGVRPAPAAPTVASAPVPDRAVRPDGIEKRLAGPDTVALRSALIVLLQGDAEKSIAILEPALTGRPSADPSSAPLHAYLGVAYATRALSSVNQDGPARQLREKALAEFRLAVSAQRDYRLSPRVVSPKIVELFEQVRSN